MYIGNFCVKEYNFIFIAMHVVLKVKYVGDFYVNILLGKALFQIELKYLYMHGGTWRRSYELQYGCVTLR